MISKIQILLLAAPCACPPEDERFHVMMSATTQTVEIRCKICDVKIRQPLAKIPVEIATET